MARSTLPALPFDVPTTMVIGGVDTHLDVHVAAAVNQIGGLLGTASFPTTPLGYGQLIDWLTGFGPVVQVGVEGTSSYGAGLTRALQAEGVEVVEVDRVEPSGAAAGRQVRHHRRDRRSAYLPGW